MNLITRFFGISNQFKAILFAVPWAMTIVIGSGHSAAWAQDPFRTDEPRDIGKHTERAFKTVFLQGDYKTVAEELKIAEVEEPEEPLAHALLASLAYTEQNWSEIKKYATQTIETAQALEPQDPVRGNLYLAVGHFLDGAYIYEKEGALSAINKLQLVFKYLDRAEDADPNDPELNLIKGYMDLLLAVNLPFSKPEQAIARFEDYAAPNYLVERGLAVAYRDLKDYNQALKYANKALKTAPENPEHYYLKGQILRKIGKQENSTKVLTEAVENFELALGSSEQLPEFILKTLKREHRLTKEKIAEIETAQQS